MLLCVYKVAPGYVFTGVCLSTRGRCTPPPQTDTPLGRNPPLADTSPRQTPLGGHPLWSDTPHRQTPPSEIATAAEGTHPTRKYFC